MNWHKLIFENDVAINFEQEIIIPLLDLSEVHLDIKSGIGGVFGYGSAGNFLAYHL